MEEGREKFEGYEFRNLEMMKTENVEDEIGKLGGERRY